MGGSEADEGQREGGRLMDDKFADDVLAEFAVLNAAIIAALKHLAETQQDPASFLQQIHDRALRGFNATNYWSVPAERREALLANIEARWDDLIASVKPDAAET